MKEVLKGVLKRAKISEKGLKQNICIGKSYLGKHDIPCNLENEALPKLLEHVRVSTRAKIYKEMEISEKQPTNSNDEIIQDKDKQKTLQQNDEILSQIFLCKGNNKKSTWSDISL